MFLAETVAAATEAGEAFAKFLAVESQTPEELAAGLRRDFDRAGVRALRERPVMSVADGRSMILDPPRGIAGVLGLRRRLRILRLRHPPADVSEPPGSGRPRRLRPARTRRRGSGIRDRRDGRRGAGGRLLRDRGRLHSGGRDRFARPGGPGPGGAGAVRRGGPPGRTRQGVAQLARSVGAVARSEWSGERGEFARTTVLHPVLLAHDTRPDTPILGELQRTNSADRSDRCGPARRWRRWQ